MAWPGKAWLGEVWRGEARLGEDRFHGGQERSAGPASPVRRGSASRHGWAWLGTTR